MEAKKDRRMKWKAAAAIANEKFLVAKKVAQWMNGCGEGEKRPERFHAEHQYTIESNRLFPKYVYEHNSV